MSEYCGSCGHRNENKHKFCIQCGKDLALDAEVNPIKVKKKSNLPGEESKKNEKLSSAKEDLNKVKRAGKSAQFLGWIVLILTPIMILPGSTGYDIGTTLSIYMFILGPVGLFLVYSGKKIVNLDKNSSKYLNANLVFNVPFLFGLIPILVLCNTLWGRSALKRIKETGLRPRPTIKFTRNQKLHLVLAVSLFLLIGVSTYYSNNLDNSINLDHSSVSNGSVYTSASFSTKFPRTPEVESTTVKVQGYDVPNTTYLYGSSTSAYMIQVTDYPEVFDMSDVSARLEGALDGMKGTYSNSSILSKEMSVFKGYKSMDATIMGDYNGQSVTIITKSFLVGQRLYLIAVLGLSSNATLSSEYNNFVNSFSLL